MLFEDLAPCNWYIMMLGEMLWLSSATPTSLKSEVNTYKTNNAMPYNMSHTVGNGPILCLPKAKSILLGKSNLSYLR